MIHIYNKLCSPIDELTSIYYVNFIMQCQFSRVLRRMSVQCDCDYIIKDDRDGWEQHYDNCRVKLFLRENSDDYKKKYPRKSDGSLLLQNAYLDTLECDVLYHLAMSTDSHDLPILFGDVKFVCMGGTEERMESLARYLAEELGIEATMENLTKASHRYAMFKVGPVLSVSHGIGIPSMTILLQEVIKLLSYAKAKNPIIFRIGTSGGLGLEPGSVVVSSFALSGIMTKTYDLPVLGRMVSKPAIFDTRLAQEVCSLASDEDQFKTVMGGTMAADDFYRGQARLDGPFCMHTEREKLDFLHRLRDLGVRNIEMEATAFSAMTYEAGVRAADVCVTLVDRLLGDQVTTPKNTMLEWQKRPMLIVGRYIKTYLEHKNNYVT